MNCYMEVLVPQPLVIPFGGVSIVLEMALYMTRKREVAVLMINACAISL